MIGSYQLTCQTTSSKIPRTFEVHGAVPVSLVLELKENYIEIEPIKFLCQKKVKTIGYRFDCKLKFNSVDSIVVLTARKSLISLRRE